MQAKNRLVAARLVGLTIVVTTRVMAQGSPPVPAPPASDAKIQAPGAGGGRFRGLVPGKQRPPGDPAQIAHGKTLYGVSCTGCHGADLRGGDLGGPNLLRSQVALSDQNGELILPVIQGSRQDSGMPAIPISPQDGLAVAAYIRSVVDTIGSQGRPPSVGKEAPSILVGDASAGQAYFVAKCSSCHSPTGDLKGIAARITDPKTLQTTWVAGGVRRRRMPAAVRRALPPPPCRLPCRQEKASKAGSFKSTISWLPWGWPTGPCARSAATKTCRKWKSTIR